MRQLPTSVPVSQTARFAPADAEKPAAVLNGQPGYACLALASACITAGPLRVSVGLGDDADLIAGLAQALEAARAAAPAPDDIPSREPVAEA